MAACNITVDWANVFGLTDQMGKLLSIHVEGTAVNCSSVKVTFSCASNSLLPETAKVSPTQKWSCDFNNPPASCDCGKIKITVLAECDDGVHICRNDDYDAEHDFICKVQTPVPPICVPVITWSSQSGNCSNNMRQVNVTADVNYPPQCGPCTAELRDASKNLLDGPKTGNNFQLNHAGNYPGNGQETFYCAITSPPFPYPWANTVNLAPCAGTIPGGAVAVGTKPKEGLLEIPCTCITNSKVEFGECQKNTGMVPTKVIVTASLFGTDCDPKMIITAELRDDYNNLLDGPKTGNSIQLEYQDNYPGGSIKTFHYIITNPPKCAKCEGIVVNVPECNIVEEDTPPGGGGGSGCGSMVWIVGSILSLAAVLSALLLVGTLCGGIPPVWLIYVVVGLDIVAGLTVALWYILCHLVPGCQCPTGCDWLQIGAMTTFATASIVGWLSPCCPLAGWIAIGLLAVAAGAATSWGVGCKPSQCQIYKTYLLAITSGVVPAIAYMALVPQLAACGSSVIAAASATAGAILGILVAVCAKKGSP